MTSIKDVGKPSFKWWWLCPFGDSLVAESTSSRWGVLKFDSTNCSSMLPVLFMPSYRKKKMVVALFSCAILNVGAELLYSVLVPSTHTGCLQCADPQHSGPIPFTFRISQLPLTLTWWLTALTVLDVKISSSVFGMQEIFSTPLRCCIITQDFKMSIASFLFFFFFGEYSIFLVEQLICINIDQKKKKLIYVSSSLTL